MSAGGQGEEDETNARCRYGGNVWIKRYTTLNHKRLTRHNSRQGSVKDKDAGLFLF